MGVTQEQPASSDPGDVLLHLYEISLPQVYGYLLSRCRSRPLAEDLTAETFLAAVAATRQRPAPPLGPAWLVGVARHKLADYWRRQAREERGLRLIHDEEEVPGDDLWEARLDAIRAREVPMRRSLSRSGERHCAGAQQRDEDELGEHAAEGAAGVGPDQRLDHA